MTEPTLHFVKALDATGLHRMAYWEWAGPRADAPVLVCVHGLSRQGRDFDALARELSCHYRVICPDVVGRGRSDWLRQPLLYQIPTYAADMVTLLARLDVEQVDWLGTSMGGLIALALTGLPGAQGLIGRLVLNDVGPAMNFEALQRIGLYLGKAPSFSSEQEGADYLQRISADFGPHTPAQWLALSRPMLKQQEGRYALHYDPAIAAGFAAVTPELVAQGEALLWAAYEALRCPTLLLRGAQSDLLSPEVAARMAASGPRAKVVEIAGVGHAPTLVDPAQIQVVKDFLLA